MIEAGETWPPKCTIDQPSATTWYHPRLHGKTAQHVYRELADMFIIDDEDFKKLPSNYDINDIQLPAVHYIRAGFLSFVFRKFRVQISD